MVDAFTDGAQQSGQRGSVENVYQKKIAGCFACEYRHAKGNGVCIQKDDMQEVYSALYRKMCIRKRLVSLDVLYFAYKK